MQEWTTLLKEMVQSSPSLVCILLIIFFFLRYLDAKDKRDQADFNKRDLTITKISDQAFSVHEKSTEALIQNSQVLGEITKVIEKCKRQ